ncbi:hypothetical protein MTO96_051016 [Rhipicephalus appendiculatus]
MDNTQADPTLGVSLAAGRSRQMETLLREASRIIGPRANFKSKHLSPQGVSLARKVRATGRPGKNRAAKIQKQKRVSPPRPDEEEITQHPPTPSVQQDVSPIAPDQVVTLYFKSPTRAQENSSSNNPPAPEPALVPEGTRAFFPFPLRRHSGLQCGFPLEPSRAFGTHQLFRGCGPRLRT